LGLDFADDDASLTRADGAQHARKCAMNVKTTMQGDKLIIEVDCSKAAIDSAPRSKSGKSQMVASTNGFAAVGPVKISLNVIA